MSQIIVLKLKVKKRYLSLVLFFIFLALAMYPVFLEANSVCGQVGQCKQNSYVKTMTPTCDECTGGVAAVAAIIGEEGTIVEIMDFLKVFFYQS